MGCHTWFYKKGFKSEKDFTSRRRIKGHWYVEDTKRPVPLKTELGDVEYYHDLFRIGNYPDDVLLSEKETIDFIDKHKIEKVNWVALKEFWQVYPDGMICFG